MSMMQNMLSDMIKQALPAEVLELITPEKIKELGDKVNAFVTDLRSGIDRIEAKQDTILAELRSIKNVNGSDNTGSALVNGNDASSGNGSIATD